jgi:hypothetical protein
MSDWFCRPGLHVADVSASIRFYVEQPRLAEIVAA